MPFGDLLSTACSSDTPNSLQSLLLFNYTSHLTDTVISDYWLMTNPLRLIPKKPVKVDIGSIHVGKDFSDQMQAILAPTFSMITVESFREAFKQLGDGAVTLLEHQVASAFDELWPSLLDNYNEVKSRLTRIADSSLTTSCKEVYERFEGAYRNFIEEQDIKELFNNMAQIGNLLAICEMMDHAFLLQNLSEQQIGAFLCSINPLDKVNQSLEKTDNQDLFNGFDKIYQASKGWFGSLYTIPRDTDEIVPPFLALVLQQFQMRIQENNGDFEESSPTLLDQTSLRGFAAMWSVLEFVFS